MDSKAQRIPTKWSSRQKKNKNKNSWRATTSDLAQAQTMREGRPGDIASFARDDAWRGFAALYTSKLSYGRSSGRLAWIQKKKTITEKSFRNFTKKNYVKCFVNFTNNSLSTNYEQFVNALL